MFKNYVKIALRNIRRNPGYSIINISGLAIGIAVCIIIAFFIIHELSYDDFLEDSDKLYQINVHGQINGQPIRFSISMAALQNVLENDYPEVRSSVRFGSAQQMTFKYEDQNFLEDYIISTSPKFLDVFSFKLIYGDPVTALNEPNTIILTESVARKIFGNTNPVGKLLLLNNAVNITVSGVCEDLPSNTHMRFTAITSNPQPVEDIGENWGQFRSYNYLRLNPGVDPIAFEEKIRNLAMEKMQINPETHGMEFTLHLKPVRDIHLHSDTSYNFGDIGNITYVYIFAIIAGFILIIASINFINLTTAYYSIRAKEIGVRKVIGAGRRQIARQFITESIIITIIATILALIIVKLIQPLFNNIIGKELDLNTIINVKMVGIAAILLLFTGFLSGFYPSVYLSAINPVSNFRGKLSGGKSKSILRNVLVIFQFAISITLICSTGIIIKQWQHFQHKNLGFDKENVLILRLSSEEVLSQANSIKDKMRHVPGIISASISSNLPMSGSARGHGFFPEGHGTDKPWLFKTMQIDSDFLNTFNIELIDGRNFGPEPENERLNILINTALARSVGWEDAVGKTIHDPMIGDNEDGTPMNIIGVVNDFHVQSLREKIEPMILYNTQNGNFLSLRIAPGNIFTVLDNVKEQWSGMVSSTSINYFFLDEQFDSIHKQERKLGQTFIYFTSLAIVIACMGLFGLASYATTRRVKEIGIRKVLGSSSGKIMALVSRDFSILVLIANVIAWPVAWYAMSRWLENFEYRTNISIWDFLISGIIAVAIAFLTVGYHTIKAANTNPVKSLRYE